MELFRLDESCAMPDNHKNYLTPSNDKNVTIVEVGPRDGLQSEAFFVPTAKKVKLIELLSQSGLKRIETTSFVHPETIPALKDADALLGRIQKKPGVIYSALVPNMAGLRRALKTTVDEIALFLSASETHNQKNLNMSMADSLKGFAEIAKIAKNAGRSLRGYVATAFGCIDEGHISAAQVKEIIRAYADLGVSEVVLCDTFGMANPRLTADFFEKLFNKTTAVRLAAHFHNNRGLGLANICAALKTGVRVFDSAIGGLGGCPTSTNAKGNVATEDLVNMLEEMGFATGVNFDKLIPAYNLVKQVLAVDLPSHTYGQGRPVWQKKQAVGV